VTRGDHSAVSAPSLPGLLVARAAATPARVAWRRLSHGVWSETQWAELESLAAAYAAGFAAAGVTPGCRVPMIVGPGLEASAAAAGLLGLGATVVSVHPGLRGAELESALAGVDAPVAVAEDAEQTESLVEALAGMSPRCDVFVVDGQGLAGAATAVHQLVDVADRGRGAPDDVDAWRASVERLDGNATALLALTAGGSGAPRPVALTHANLVAAAQALTDAVPVRPDDEILSYLPPSHVVERVLSTGVAPLVGAVVNTGGGPEEVLTDLHQVRPTVLLGVPGLWDQVADRVAEGPSRAGWLERTLFDRGLRRGRRHLEARRNGARGRLTGWLSTRPARARLGLNRTRAALCALAPLSDETADTLGALGLVVRECYGNAESCGILTAEPADAVRPGSVGRPVDATEVRVGAGDELLARGPQISPDHCDADGWLHTGDRARIDDEALVRLTGRIDDVIVTGAGASVDAGAVARALAAAPLVQRVVVTGDGRPDVGALLELDPAALRAWAVARSAPSNRPRELAAWPALLDELERNVAEANRDVPPESRVQRFRVLPEPLVLDGELTATRRLRRGAAIRAHADLVDEMYRG
jgi:long-chain acyl-CoA synthetase